MNIGISKIALSLACCALPFTLSACGGDSSSVDSPEDVEISLSSSEEEDSSSSAEADSKAKSSSSKAKSSSSTDKEASSSSQDSDSNKDSSSSNKESSSSGNSSSNESSSSQDSTKTESSSSDESSSSQESSSSVGIQAPAASFTDSRDGKTYKLTNIGGQIWMAEDLQYGDSSLYDYKDAVKACPDDFHLPSIKEFQTLVDFVGGETVAAKKLKSTTGWPNDSIYGDWNGTDDYGFNAKPVKYGDGTGTDENFWSTTRDFSKYETALFLKLAPHPTSKIDSTAPRPAWDYEPFCDNITEKDPDHTCIKNGEPATRLSVRCLSNQQECNGTTFDNTKQFCQDGSIYDICYGHMYDGKKYKCVNQVIYDRVTDSVYKPSWRHLNPALTYEIFQDVRDGQYYKTIEIDGVTWFAENLNYDTTGSRCYEDMQYYCDLYGRMYTQKLAIATNDIPTRQWQGLCPPGSHLATNDEYIEIYNKYPFMDLLSAYSENDTHDYSRYQTNNTGLSLLVPGDFNSRLNEWQFLNWEGRINGADFTEYMTKDWLKKGIAKLRTPDDQHLGIVRCIVN